jgi:hypothetical protein
VLGEEPRPAYDRVHLTSLFDGRSPEDLALPAPPVEAASATRSPRSTGTGAR